MTEARQLQIHKIISVINKSWIRRSTVDSKVGMAADDFQLL